MAPPGRVQPQHSFFFNAAAYWPHGLRWQYNNADAPGQLNLDDAGIVQLFSDAAAKWTAVCGVSIVYDGPTAVIPGALPGGAPDRLNVIGWRPPQGGEQAATSLFSDVMPNGEHDLVDADIQINPAFAATPELVTSLMTHEWGHAIGLGHSPVANTLMSGPPETAYSNLSDLTPDDVQGCRCLYGLPPTTQEGYICSLPPKIDFGTVTVGNRSATQQVNVINDGNAPLTIGGLQLQSNAFAVPNNTCASRVTLQPGESCSVGLAGAPNAASVQRTEALLNTSVGPYRIPLSVKGLAIPPPPLNFEGAWWNAPAGSEDGWGLTLAHQDDAIFLTWFTYDNNRKSTWLSMTALGIGNNAFTGTLYRSTGPPLSQEPFDPNAVRRVEVGVATLSFADADRGTFSYMIDNGAQIKSIARFAFGPLPICTFAGLDSPLRENKFEGNWWTALGAESGWGMYFVHQGDIIFASWFIYDEDGTPTWVSATTNRTSDRVYQGEVLRTTGPPFDVLPFDSGSVSRTSIGTMTLTFIDDDHALFEYSVQAGNPPSTVARTKLLERLIFRPPGTRCEQ